MAADFVQRLNAHKESEPAGRLPKAAEACFSIAEHLAVIDRRIECLSGIQPELTIDFEAANFANALATHWRATRHHIAQAAEEMGLNLTRPLSQWERVISPSDFGFTNTLLRSDRSNAFNNFAYAGWDDIAKIAGAIERAAGRG